MIKKLIALTSSVLFLVLFSNFAFSLCPSEVDTNNELRIQLRTVIFNFLSNPPSSVYSISEILDLLDFYKNEKDKSLITNCDTLGSTSNEQISTILEKTIDFEDCICINEFAPVCGKDGNTYSNSCYAMCNGVEIACNRECPCETKKCSDGTPYDSCSINKPKYCENGGLIDKCSLCSCPEGQSCEEDETCIVVGEEAYFRFDYPPRPATFVIKLTNAEKIQEARDILAQRQTDATHIMGIIVKEAVDYNQPWSYHLEPSTIEFFESAIEVCDAGIQYVEDNLGEACGAFLPDCRWCPWQSSLIEEVGKNPGTKLDVAGDGSFNNGIDNTVLGLIGMLRFNDANAKGFGSDAMYLHTEDSSTASGDSKVRLHIERSAGSKILTMDWGSVSGGAVGIKKT